MLFCSLLLFYGLVLKDHATHAYHLYMIVTIHKLALRISDNFFVNELKHDFLTFWTLQVKYIKKKLTVNIYDQVQS